jgi:hypothetical protein
MKLPDEFIEMVRQYSGQEDSAKMATAKLLSDFWLEYGRAIEHEGKDKRWYIESVCASVGMSPASGYNRVRVGTNIIQRNYHTDNESISFGHWLALLRNSPKVDGLVETDELNKRLEWYYAEMDKHGGQPPSVRDIENHYKKNGKKPEWELYWKRIVKAAEKLWDLHQDPQGVVPDGLIGTIISILDKEDK